MNKHNKYEDDPNDTIGCCRVSFTEAQYNRLMWLLNFPNFKQIKKLIDTNNTNNKNEHKSIKNDNEKSRVDLIPSDSLMEIGKVFKYGAQKYSPDNWRYDFNWSRLYSATLRHLYQFWSGEDLDSETHISHIAHAGCNILMLLSLILNNKGNDDRFNNEEK